MMLSVPLKKDSTMRWENFVKKFLTVLTQYAHVFTNVDRMCMTHILTTQQRKQYQIMNKKIKINIFNIFDWTQSFQTAWRWAFSPFSLRLRLLSGRNASSTHLRLLLMLNVLLSFCYILFKHKKYIVFKWLMAAVDSELGSCQFLGFNFCLHFTLPGTFSPQILKSYLRLWHNPRLTSRDSKGISKLTLLQLIL